MLRYDFIASVILTLLATPLLGEPVGRLRWAAVGIGFTGTVLAAMPVGLSLSPAAIMALVAAALWQYAVILTRQITRFELSLVQTFFNNCFFPGGTGVASMLTWHPPTVTEIWLLLLVAFLGDIGQSSLFGSTHFAPTSLTMPLEYWVQFGQFCSGSSSGTMRCNRGWSSAPA